MFKRKNNKKGFTIVELTIVVSVIAILSAVLIPTFAGVTKKARQTADEAAVRELNNVIATADKDLGDVAEVITFLEGKNILAGSYNPMSKGFSFVWNTKDDKVMLYSEKEKAIVFPKEYAGKAVEYVTLVKEDVEEIVTAENEASFTNGGVVAVNKDITLSATEKYVYVEKDLVVDLSAEISSPECTTSGGVFTVAKGSTLTLNGNGTVNAKMAATNDYNIAVWAYGGDVVINGGTYTNIGAKAVDDKGLDNNNELIYATKGGKITINGGIFMGANPKYVLNCKDDAACMIVVQGGKFLNYNPATMANDTTIIFDEDEYKVVTTQDGDDTWYEVVKK
jgi:prepilin-type N-terminal cleavage/methylation domain-containing protein